MLKHPSKCEKVQKCPLQRNSLMMRGVHPLSPLSHLEPRPSRSPESGELHRTCVSLNKSGPSVWVQRWAFQCETSPLRHAPFLCFHSGRAVMEQRWLIPSLAADQRLFHISSSSCLFSVTRPRLSPAAGVHIFIISMRSHKRPCLCRYSQPVNTFQIKFIQLNSNCRFKSLTIYLKWRWLIQGNNTILHL